MISGDFAIPSAASLNGTLMCLVGLLRLLQVRPVLILPSRETSHSHRRPSRARLASPYKQMAARNGTGGMYTLFFFLVLHLVLNVGAMMRMRKKLIINKPL